MDNFKMLEEAIENADANGFETRTMTCKQFAEDLIECNSDFADWEVMALAEHIAFLRQME